jgi:hypothetical protein
MRDITIPIWIVVVFIVIFAYYVRINYAPGESLASYGLQQGRITGADRFELAMRNNLYH